MTSVNDLPLVQVPHWLLMGTMFCLDPQYAWEGDTEMQGRNLLRTQESRSIVSSSGGDQLQQPSTMLLSRATKATNRPQDTGPSIHLPSGVRPETYLQSFPLGCAHAAEGHYLSQAGLGIAQDEPWQTWHL